MNGDILGAGVCGTVAPVWLEAAPPPNGTQVWITAGD